MKPKKVFDKVSFVSLVRLFCTKEVCKPQVLSLLGYKYLTKEKIEMPRELEMETVTIYCLQSHSGDIFIVLSWAEQSTCGTWYNDPSGHLTWPGYWAGALL